MAHYDSVLDTIGNTPLVEISELSPNPRPDPYKARGRQPRRLG